VTIRAKLYTAIVVAVAGLAVTAGVGIWALNSLDDHFDHVQQAADDRALALQLKYDVTDTNGWQTAYGYDNGASRPQFLAAVARFRRNLARARTDLTGGPEQRALDRLAATFDEFMRLDAQAFSALRAGDTDETRRILLGPEIVTFRRAAAAAQTLAATEDARAAQEDESFEDARKDALRFLILAALIAAFLIVILLVTATDLARSAERALGSANPRPPRAGS
jgi:methyl-accepting chemotaxis protein